jgi:hypothetical protein
MHDYHREAIAKLTTAGVVRGYGDGTYRPGTHISRAQMATYLVGALEVVAGDLEWDGTHHFSDVSDTSAHARSVSLAWEQGLLQGRTAPTETSQGTFVPRADTARDQMASFLVGALHRLGEVAEDAGE